MQRPGSHSDVQQATCIDKSVWRMRACPDSFVPDQVVVIAFSVAQRTQEIGVRMALGAQRREVVGMIVRQGMAIALADIALGVPSALALARAMAVCSTMPPTDPATFAFVAGLPAASALAASSASAIRAALVDAIVALRCE